MGFVTTPKIKIGTKIKLTRNVSSMAGIMMKDTIVTVTNISTRGYDIVDDEGHNIRECGWDIGYPITSNRPNEYFGYIEIYIGVYFKNGTTATTKIACDFRKPDGIQTLMDNWYNSTIEMYNESTDNIDHVSFITKEEYERLENETTENAHIQWRTNE